jgi:hypothetical protein
MDQPLAVLHQEGNVLLMNCLGMSDIPGNTKFLTLQEIRDRLFLVLAEAVRVFNGYYDVAVADPSALACQTA